MSWLLPLPVAIPLLTAAAIAGGEHVMPRRLADALGIAAAAAATGSSLVIMTLTESHDVLHWFGGWQPRSGVVLGIDFAAGPLAAGMAALVGGLVLAGLVYSWTYLQEAARLFNVLMLVACGAMCGFVLSGDLFNMFVWLELTGVAAYALTGFDTQRIGPVQGAVNFAITNTIGGYFVLIGIALLYARTGALNLAQIGRTLAGQRPGGLVVVALTLVVVGFLVKAAVVPFHLWLADAYAVAPVPVCVLFAGAMTDIGLFGVARIYWTVFDAPFGAHQHAVRGVLLGIGVLTALLGAVMCFLQRHLKRLLAFSTISHVGIMLAGIGLLDSKGLAGMAVVLLAHALLTAGLFLAAGILLERFGAIDELWLHGKGRALPLVGVLFGLCAVGLTGTPYVGEFLGHSLIDDGATSVGIEWLQPLVWLATAVTASAILRTGARIFLGWGPSEDPLLSAQPPDEPPGGTATLPLMVAVTAVLTLLGVAVSVVPGLQARSEHGAGRFRDRAAYADRVLHGQSVPETPRLPFVVEKPAVESWAYGIGCTALALALALFGLYRQRLPEALRAVAERMLGPPLDGLRALHSGVVGDYVMWITVGTAVIGGIWAFTLR